MTTNKTRIKHSPEFKVEALKLAEKVGVASAARQLGLHSSQIYGWRKNSKKDISTSQREKDLDAEVAKLKRQLAATRQSSARQYANSLIQKSKTRLTIVKVVMAQGASRKSWLRMVITIM